MPTGRWLDPETAAALDEAPPFFAELSEEDLPAVRRQWTASLRLLELSDQVQRIDHVVPGAPDVAVRVHRPLLAAERGGPAPCLYSIHGGGYVFGSHGMEDLRLDRWCASLGCVGVAVDYRLAPDTPYPGPLEDCYAGLRWVHQHAGELGIDPHRIGIGGASAGGGIAAALAILGRDRGEPPMAFQFLMYPMLDDRQTTTSSQWQVPIWSPTDNAFGWRAYLGDLYGSDRVPATAAAARATDVAGLPPAYLAVGTADIFCDEDICYAQRLNHAGVPTELHVYPGAPHAFDSLVPATRLARRARRDAVAWLAGVMGVDAASDRV